MGAILPRKCHTSLEFFFGWVPKILFVYYQFWSFPSIASLEFRIMNLHNISSPFLEKKSGCYVTGRHGYYVTGRHNFAELSPRGVKDDAWKYFQTIIIGLNAVFEEKLAHPDPTSILLHLVSVAATICGMHFQQRCWGGKHWALKIFLSYEYLTSSFYQSVKENKLDVCIVLDTLPKKCCCAVLGSAQNCGKRPS